jgi:hypothetical protein
MVGTPIVLKRWTPNFDAKREKVDVVPVWVRLPGLPMQYWNPVRFSAIGNRLRDFLEADYSFEETGLMTVARILVRLDLRPGLLKEIKIKATSGIFLQPLDYEGIPFRCHRCHVYGHGVAECTLPFKGKFRGTLVTGSGPEMDRTRLDRGDSGGTLAGSSRDRDFRRVNKRHTSTPMGPSSVDRGSLLTKAQKSSLQAGPRTQLSSGKQQFSLPLNVSNVFSLTPPLGTLGIDFPPPLGLPSSLALSRPVSAFCPLPPGVLFPSSSSPVVEQGQVTNDYQSREPEGSTTPLFLSLGDPSSVFIKSSLNPVSSLPSPPGPPTGTPSTSQSSSSSQSSEGSIIRYTLRNRAIFSDSTGGGSSEEQLGAGLGSLTRVQSSSRGRGRRSHFLLAQDRAKLDVASGRQSSIEWALREKQSQELVTS